MLGKVLTFTNEQEVERIICSSPCLNLKRYYRFAWNVEDYESIIEEREFASWAAR